MSIWCSWPSVGHDPWEITGPPRGGEVRTYADGFSNHHPDATGSHELPAHVGICAIAPWCVPGHDEDGNDGRCAGCGERHDHPEVGEWVRLTVAAPTALSWWHAKDERPRREPMYAAVVMDEAAARQLAADLLAWADEPKVRPIRPDADTPGATGAPNGSQVAPGVSGDRIGPQIEETRKR